MFRPATTGRRLPLVAGPLTYDVRRGRTDRFCHNVPSSIGLSRIAESILRPLDEWDVRLQGISYTSNRVKVLSTAGAPVGKVTRGGEMGSALEETGTGPFNPS